MTRRTRERISELASRRWTDVEAEEVLTAWKKSGLGMSAFARTHDVSVQRLQWWKKKAARRVAMEGGKSADAEVQFAPVVLTGVGSRPAAVVRLGVLEVEVHEPDRVPARWLLELVDAAKGS
jgi:transposase-like protein